MLVRVLFAGDGLLRGCTVFSDSGGCELVDNVNVEA